MNDIWPEKQAHKAWKHRKYKVDKVIHSVCKLYLSKTVECMQYLIIHLSTNLFTILPPWPLKFSKFSVILPKVCQLCYIKEQYKSQNKNFDAMSA